MKQVKFTMPLRILAVLCGLFLSVSAFAQQITVNGHVKDATGEPIIGATVRTASQDGGVVSDFDGNFTITTNEGATLLISYIGYQQAEVKAAPNVTVVLKDDASQSLNEVVVIGYGVAKKSDLTGSVTAMKPDSKNKGLVVNAQDMMQGKIAGVNVTSGGGTPGGGATIRIRGGSSLNATNDPLIVIDGVAMDNQGVKGLANGLSMVNPQDIESFNVLKDASATAIYGSRGSNGVIIITTKKGRKGMKPTVSYSGSVTASMKRKTIDVMNGDEYRDFVHKLYEGSSRQEQIYAALGNTNTDWQDEIYRTAISTDHNLTFSGSVGETLPYRLSLGYTNEQGILKTSSFERYTAALNLNPSFLDNHLTFNINVKGMYANSQYADGDAINAAVWYDPTQPVKAAGFENFGGYHTWTNNGASLNDPNYPLTYNSLATKNPMAILDLKDDCAHSKSMIVSGDIDYKVHGFEDLRLHMTLGADVSEGKQNTDVSPMSPLAFYYGSHGWDKILKRNHALSAYAQYYHDFNDKAKNHFDIMGGYEWQHFWRSQNNNYWGLYPETNADQSLRGQKRNETKYRYMTENYLVSFFGRANWSLLDRYYLTVTVREDGSSRFRDHWAMFPSAAFAWKIKDENKFREINWLSDLKLRLGYGMTGQQEGIGDYTYFSIYSMNTGSDSFYPLTDNGILARPNAVNKNLKWETTTTYNIGLDWGILNQRLSGSVDWYYRKTTDLINNVSVPAGSNFKNMVVSNIGSMVNKGVEAAISWKALQTKDWYWIIDYNFTYNKNKITKLTGGNDKDYFIATGGIDSGTGVNCQAHKVGETASSFYVYQQAYDENGMPLEGVVVDRDGNGKITEEDKYIYKSPVAPVTMGLSSRLEYKNWDFGFTLRASIGNYIFNDFMAGSSNVGQAAVYDNSGYLTNRPLLNLPANWQTYDLTSTLSDRWVQNASFLKCDNITLGYSFDNVFKAGRWNGISGRLYATASNVFTITKYDGIDPEVFGGIDNKVYPRPFSVIVGLNLNF